MTSILSGHLGRRLAAAPSRALAPAVLVIVAILIGAPLVKIALVTLAPDTVVAWREVLASRLAPNLFFKPLTNTLVIGAAVAAGCVLIGGFLAWLTVMTDVPLRRGIALLSTLPFMVPSFATALAWGVLFRNDRVGGQTGFLEGLGFDIPDWLAWGMAPSLIVLTMHYFSLAFTVIAAALATINADLVEAAEMAGARRLRIFASIILPVRMQTLSTRIYGMIEVGQTARGYVIAILLVLISAAFLWLGNRMVAGRRSYATITGKGGRRQRTRLGRARWPLAILALTICFLSTIVPILVLAASSLAPSSSSLFSNWTLHYWLGQSEPSIAQGLAGIAYNPDILRATAITLGLGVTVALVGSMVGLLVSYTIVQERKSVFATVISQLSFLPLLIPGIAFGAAYIALYGAPIGPFPALYGTFTLLVLAATAYLIPFSVQTGRAVIQQVSGDLDESAQLTGASLPRRLFAITVPLSIRGLTAGALLVFVKIVRDLSLVVLLFTPTMPVLSVIAYRYASDGFTQFANAVTLVILVISVAMSLLANRIQTRSQPWLSNEGKPDR